MYKEIEQVIISSLLHDIGKLHGRAYGSKKKHSEIGSEYIREKTIGKEDWRNIIQGIEYHHEDALRKANLPSDHIAYIICEADNISAGLDRRVIEQDGKTMWDKKSSLKSVFNIINGKENNPELAYDLKTLKKNDPVNFPKEQSEIIISQQRYEYVFNDFEKGINQFIEGNMSTNSLLRLIELSFFSIPSSTDASQQTDVSLYHHSKTTTLLASAMYQYFIDKNLLNFKENCLIKKEKLRNEEIFLLVSGDISGIQKFIYSVSSKGALKSLRGRSLYIELLAEHIIDEILETAELSRSNLIYSGGGHFYLVLPNTDKSKKLIENSKNNINEWLLETYSTELYIEMSYVEATANNLANNLSEKAKSTNELGEIYKKVGSKISEGKIKRYDTDTLKKIMLDDLKEEHVYGGRECSVCGRVDDINFEGNVNFETDELEICSICENLYLLGDIIPKIHHKKEPMFIAINSNVNPSQGLQIGLPSINKEKKYLNVVTLKGAEAIIKDDSKVRFYSLNNDSFGYNFANNIWIASYNIPNSSHPETLIDLESLAKSSTGIKRLAMLKMDVDNLGNTFKNAFIDKSSTNPYQFVSISRSTSLSYLFSMFFRYEINKICEKGEDTEFYLFPDRKSKEPYNLVIIYSGGDDILVVGSWDHVLEFAVNLRKQFTKYTMGKITLSAGLGLFSSSFPINQMAKITGLLEKEAKDNGKDSISLFGEGADHIYKWDEFEKDVIGDKLSKLYSWFDIDNDIEDHSKIPYSPSGFYRLMLYLSELVKNKSKKMNVAKVAYTIARMEPDTKRMKICKENFEDFKKTFYSWVLDRGELEKLLTAMVLIIYLNRKE